MLAKTRELLIYLLNRNRFLSVLFAFNTLDWSALEQSDLNLQVVLPRARCWTRCSPAVGSDFSSSTTARCSTAVLLAQEIHKVRSKMLQIVHQ